MSTRSEQVAAVQKAAMASDSLQSRWLVRWKTWLKDNEIGSCPPSKEFYFCKPRQFRFDFAWELRKVAVEIDGGQFTGGRHGRIGGMASDAEKSRIAASLGWRVLIFVTEDVEKCRGFDELLAALKYGL